MSAPLPCRRSGVRASSAAFGATAPVPSDTGAGADAECAPSPAPTKRCGRCGGEKDRAAFNRDRTKRDGLQSYCRECHRANAKKPELRQASRERSRRYRESNPEARRAQHAVERAIRTGRMQRGFCEQCGSEEAEGHHYRGYDRPLDVQWLCRSCHINEEPRRGMLREAGSSELEQILRAWLLLVIGVLTLAVTLHACSDRAEAHALQAWKCQYLAYQRAENGERYAWKVRCIQYRRGHAMAHRYGRLWRCYLDPIGPARNRCIIRGVFGTVGQADKAVAVSWCESSHRRDARNGQYRGLFQMGSAERARFGHGSTALAQSQAALRYYRVAGWRPWECA